MTKASTTLLESQEENCVLRRFPFGPDLFIRFKNFVEYPRESNLSYHVSTTQGVATMKHCPCLYVHIGVWKSFLQVRLTSASSSLLATGSTKPVPDTCCDSLSIETTCRCDGSISRAMPISNGKYGVAFTSSNWSWNRFTLRWDKTVTRLPMLLECKENMSHTIACRPKAAINQSRISRCDHCLVSFALRRKFLLKVAQNWEAE